ncbi:MAG: single-stranded-DNA-specific exonuclease RecJ [Oceanobacter sp.]
MVQVVQRGLPDGWQLDALPPVLQRVYAARGVVDASQLTLSLKELLPYHSLKGLDDAVALLVEVIQKQQNLLVVGDFDVDGATSTALVIRAMRSMGAASVDYLVPNRFDFGYGLTPELVDVASQLPHKPDLILTVDNGIAAISGVDAAKACGIPVLVTDHHLPGETLPDAAAIVNPSQPGCDFPSKAACGCTVVFYLMLALRARLSALGHFEGGKAPNLATLLDLVALATVADVVPLDYNNRILVEQGLRRIRAGQTLVGIQALMQVAGRDPGRAVASDFGFVVGPRLNAAGRLDDMGLGIECLLTDDPDQARDMAQQLDDLNRDRKQIEASMTADAQHFIDEFDTQQSLPVGLTLFHADWHQGVIGILASRIKEKVHRPVIAFARGDDGVLKGSGRSIPGLHLRDVLDLVDRRLPGALLKFGGHAMAAGMSLKEAQLDVFQQVFDQVCREQVSQQQLTRTLEVDGELANHELALDLAEQLRYAGPWGQGFPEPVFQGRFTLVQQRIVGGRHLKLVLSPVSAGTVAGSLIDGIWFNIDPSEWPNNHCQEVNLVYQLDINEFRGRRSVQLLIQHLDII